MLSNASMRVVVCLCLVFAGGMTGVGGVAHAESPRAAVGGPADAATAAHAGERLHTLLGRLIVTDEDTRVAMQIARRAFCDGVLGASWRVAVPTAADREELLSALDAAQEEELETLLAADVQAIDATTWPAVIRALKTLRPASPEVRALARRALQVPEGYARLRDADVAMTLYLYDIERPALAAGMVADLNGPDAKLARRIARRVRIIGVASQESFARLVADAALETHGRDAIAADLGRMVPGPKRLALETALVDARMVAEGLVRQSVRPGRDRRAMARFDQIATRTPADDAMERYARGDDAAFAVVYDEIAPYLQRYLARRSANDELSQDLLQETMLHIHRGRGSFIAGSAVLPWSYAIARRLLCDAHRHDQRRPMMVEVEDVCEASDAGGIASPEAVMVARELCDDVNRLLDEMPESQRIAFELLRVDGASTQEAAGRLGTSVTAVKLRAHRAYEALRRSLRGDA